MPTSDAEAVSALKQAISILTEKGRFSSAASNQKQIAEIYETDLADLESAMEAYQQAGEWYQGEDASAYTILILAKAVHVSLKLPNLLPLWNSMTAQLACLKV